MTKLQKLYRTIQNLKELGLELGDDLLKQTSELEQEIIKKVVHPKLAVIFSCNANSLSLKYLSSLNP